MRGRAFEQIRGRDGECGGGAVGDFEKGIVVEIDVGQKTGGRIDGGNIGAGGDGDGGRGSAFVDGGRIGNGAVGNHVVDGEQDGVGAEELAVVGDGDSHGVNGAIDVGGIEAEGFV